MEEFTLNGIVYRKEKVVNRPFNIDVSEVSLIYQSNGCGSFIPYAVEAIAHGSWETRIRGGEGRIIRAQGYFDEFASGVAGIWEVTSVSELDKETGREVVDYLNKLTKNLLFPSSR